MTNPQTRQPVAAERKDRTGLAGHGATIAILVALAVIAVGIYWMTRQPAGQAVSLGAPQGVVVVGAGAFVTALIARMRDMSVMDAIEMLGEAIMGLFALIWSIVKGIFRGILSLFGWD